MARKHHLLLLGLISISLISLLGIQAYWIHTDISLQEERLNEKMQAVLLDMHHMVENDSVLSQQLIGLKNLWGRNDYFNRRSMDVHIARLRKYLKDDPGLRIVNIHGKGFILEESNLDQQK